MKKTRFSLLLASYVGFPTLIFLGGTALTYARPSQIGLLSWLKLLQ
jgi:hypothetical protein